MSDPSPVAAGTLRVGDPDVAGPLAVFPVFGPAPGLDFRSFAEAAALGAAVHELPEGAAVDAVLVHNPLDVAVLLYEGEELRGAQQDRTLDVSVLVPAGARVRVPVSCVEAGRWESERRDEAFTPSPQAAFPALRRAKSRAARVHGRADQGEVWNLVEERVTRHAATSASGAMRDAFAGREALVAALRGGIARRDEQLGAVAAIGGELCVADVVGRADVFAALHGPLVAGYALDAAERLDDPAPPAAPAVAAVQRFLDGALGAAAAPDASAAAGLGRRWRFACASAEGTRLVCDGELVALTAFPGEAPRARVPRPSRRR